LPMDSPENSGFDEMHSTGSVWWNMDGLESITGPSAKETIHAWGADSLGCAKGFSDASLKADSEG
jgi:hypothetical protein